MEKQEDQISAQSTEQHVLIPVIYISQALGPIPLNWAVTIEKIEEFKRNLVSALKKQGE